MSRCVRAGGAFGHLLLAVSPNDPGLTLASTAEGVARSTDGGRTFTKRLAVESSGGH
ncbi:hypothetical protein [Streptomyces paradoxus]|uniref:hypothetical protein n=1 Tax=Streptomyces paradoxus TaxID=66375 RepID=UPI0038292CDB